MNRFDGKVVLVTGAASGIGAATAHLFASQGASIIATDQDAEGLVRTTDALTAAGYTAIGSPCDQTDDAQVERLFTDVVAAFDRLDVCFANAGWGRVDPFLDIPLAVWRKLYDVNVTGTFLVCQQAARRMVELQRPGSIVVTSSSGAVVPAGLFAGYCSAKAALNMLVQVMAYELGAYDIRVNAVMPGVTETAMTQAFLDAGPGDSIRTQVPLGRLADPIDIANTVAFLASDEASYVNGTSLLVDGAGSMHTPGWFQTDFTQRGVADWRLRDSDGARR